MTNKEILFAIKIALEQKEKGFHSNARRFFQKATNGISSDKFNRHTVQGKLIFQYWNEAFERIV